MRRLGPFLAAVCLVSGCGAGAGSGGGGGAVIIDGGEDQTCQEFESSYDSAGDFCLGSDDCEPTRCPCAEGVVESRSCFNDSCLGVEACEEVCEGNGGVLCGDVAPTCSDDIKNGDEEGVDCGGSCSACATNPTCSDDIKNGDEEGVDCGGSCSACAEPTCSDGVRNGDEERTDCGGSCAACPPAPTCDDDIQNGSEQGVDCGGVCAACPPQSDCPFPASVTSLGSVEALEQTAASGLAVKVLEGDVAVSTGSARLELLLATPSESYDAGTYSINAQGEIPGICDTSGCLKLRYRRSGSVYEFTMRRGTLRIDEADFDRLSGRLSGASVDVSAARFASDDFRILGECDDPIAFDLDFDAPY